MNRSQMKSAIAKFKSADVSIIKDDAMRAKAQKLQAKQKGFTLLELLVVITLLATLATAALVAYDGIGENARDASAATAVTTLEGTLRNYKAIVGEYPEQFDSLANADAGAGGTNGTTKLLSDKSKEFFGQLVIPTANAAAATAADKLTVTGQIAEALSEAGLEELQAVTGATDWNAGFIPNLAMNESYDQYTTATVTANAEGSELAFPEDNTVAGLITFGGVAVTNDVALAIIPSSTGTADKCGVYAVGDLEDNFNGDTVDNNKRLNLISDAFESDGCNLVIAVGVGKEVPGATLGKAVEISQVPTVGTNDVNPKTNYARAIALFHVGTDSDEDGTIEADEILEEAHLVAIVDPEGRTIDQIVADAIADSTVD